MVNINRKKLSKMLALYLNNKPTFLAIIRVKEAILFNSFLPYQGPVLDFGCGDGFFRKVSLLKSPRLIDIGLETDKQRAKKAEEIGVYRKVQIYDGKTIPFADKTFFTVISNSVLEHITDVDGSLREIYRVLKKDGIFYLTVMVDKYEENLLGAKFFGNLYKKWMRKKAYHVHLLSEQAWRARFKKAGFKVIKKNGYLSRNNTAMLDCLQYLSLPAILTQQIMPLLSRFYCRIMKLCFEKFLQRRLIKDDKEDLYSSYFYVLKK